MFRPGPEPWHPIDATVHAILREGSTGWEPLDNEDRDFFRSNADAHQALAILTVGGALEQRLSYTLTALGDTRRVTFRAEVCGDFTKKLRALTGRMVQAIWKPGQFVHGPGTLEAIRVTADGKQAIEDYAIGITDPMAIIQSINSPGRVFLVDGPTVEDEANALPKDQDGTRNSLTQPGTSKGQRRTKKVRKIDHANATTEATDEENGHKKRNVRLSHWAIAHAETPGEWRLFQWFGNKQRWCERGLATVPQGRPAKLAQALAKNGGAISKTDAIALFRTDDRRSWPESKVFASVCKRARMDLAKAVLSDIGRITGEKDISDDPIPWDRRGNTWRCAIQVGYCCRDEKDQLRFRFAEQLVDGFAEEEMRPS